MKNKEIADLFSKMATLLEIQGENVFKIRAYQTAAENILNLSEDIATLRQDQRLNEIPGIGEALQQKIGEFLDTGKVASYEKLVAQVPESLLEVVSVPTVGPKRARLFFKELKIRDVAGLRRAAEDGTLLRLEGIQEKSVENILKGINLVEQKHERMDLSVADRVAEMIVTQLRKLPEVKQIVAAGSLRRMKETVRDIDILVDSSQPAKVMEVFVHLPEVKEIYSHGATKSSILTRDGVQVDLRVVESKSFGAALLYFTGSKELNVRLRQIAIKKSMKVNEYGIFKRKGEQEVFVAGKTEKACFKALGLPYLPPEIREDLGAEKIFGPGVRFKVPPLVTTQDIKGDLHVHSTWSDGHNSIEAIAEACRSRGYEYVAISDHSQQLRVAKGLSYDAVLRKKAEIDKLNAKYRNFRILLGTEVEIDSEGKLDYNTKILSEFDVVIAAVHTGLEQDAKTITNRLIAACQNKAVNVIAHPTCFHLGKRDPVDVDLKALARAAKDNNVFLEINAFPVRFDLNSANSFYCREQGSRFVINTDSHRLEHLDFMRFGVGIARRGWLTKKDVVNTLTLKQLLKTLRK